MHSENKHIYCTLWVFLLLNLKMQSSSKMSLLFELMVKNMRPNLISNLCCSYLKMKINFIRSQFFSVKAKNSLLNWKLSFEDWRKSRLAKHHITWVPCKPILNGGLVCVYIYIYKFFENLYIYIYIYIHLCILKINLASTCTAELVTLRRFFSHFSAIIIFCHCHLISTQTSATNVLKTT